MIVMTTVIFNGFIINKLSSDSWPRLIIIIIYAGCFLLYCVFVTFSFRIFLKQVSARSAWGLLNRSVRKNLLESVLLVLERAAYKSGLPLNLPPYRNLGSDALFTCDICLYIPVDSTLLSSSVALECKLSSSALQIPTRRVSSDTTTRRSRRSY
jgi:hypothetical protein